MLRTFRGGLLIGLAVAVAVAAGAITYERYDTKTLKRTIKRGGVETVYRSLKSFTEGKK